MSDDPRSIADLTDPTVDAPAAFAAAWRENGVRFWASDAKMVAHYKKAVSELATCIKAPNGGAEILQEGGIYFGCWLESTGTINAELLSRFLPDLAQNTFLAFPTNQRQDGLFPYKIAQDGPAFAQIQTVTPLARSVWNHYLLNGQDRDFLETMYDGMLRNDAWLAQNRDTRGTGAVEAFCCYDTGHDASPRFWHCPDSPFAGDPARYDPGNPILPFVAPDLTANVACQRKYLAKIAQELGRTNDWDSKSAQSEQALFDQCYDAADDYFYDRDATGQFVRLQSDVLLRVLACEIGDDTFFERMLEKFLLNSRKFFARYPFPSIALDDPRFDPVFAQNSWGGPTNFLSIIRAAHAFEFHDRHTELTWLEIPILHALCKFHDFAQTLSPFTGEQGFTKAYSPTILCLLDFIERLCGILPRPDGEVWFTGLVPKSIEHQATTFDTGYARRIDGHDYELYNTPERTVGYKDGAKLFSAPAGVRVVTDRAGNLRKLVGVQANEVRGTLRFGPAAYDIQISANEQQTLTKDGFVTVAAPGLTTIQHG